MEDEKKFIILVDDSLINLLIGKNALEKKYTVSTAPSAKKMLSLLKNNRPAMILLDIDMPEINGFEAIQILKSKTETKDIPVVFLISCAEVNDKYEWLYRELGAVGYITKSLNPFMLIKRIENFLENTFMTDTMSHNRMAAQEEISKYKRK
jgi:CheY-like chemotaxis protein